MNDEFVWNENVRVRVKPSAASISELKRANAALKRALRKEQVKTRKRAALLTENARILDQLLALKEANSPV